MFTLKDFLLAEAEGKDPHEEMAVKQEKLVSVVTDIRKIMGSLSMVDIDTAADDLRSFSFIDLIEALNTTEEVIRDRLSTEGGTVDVPSSRTKPKKQQNIAARGKEWKNDEKNNYERLFNSIQEQVKDTIKNILTIPQGDGSTSTLPRFVHSFNQLIVEKIITALKDQGPIEAANTIGGIIESAKRAVIDMQVRGGKTTSSESKVILNGYRRARKSTIGKKHASARTKRDRMKLIKAVASASHANTKLVRNS